MKYDRIEEHSRRPYTGGAASLHFRIHTRGQCVNEKGYGSFFKKKKKRGSLDNLINDKLPNFNVR